MSDPLATYLQDHLAGALHAIELLKAMRDHHHKEPLGGFAASLLIEIEADRDVLAQLIERRGVAPGGLKVWGAWLTEKVSRLKLKHGATDFRSVGIPGSGNSRKMGDVAGAFCRCRTRPAFKGYRF